MGLDFDVREFCAALRATKPPYECPFKECGKIYKSFAGIQCHLFNFNHENPGSSLPLGSQSPQQALTYAEAQKMVELEMEGKCQRINIFDPIIFISKEDFEASDGTIKNKSEESHAQETTTKNNSSKTNSKAAHKKTPKTKEKEQPPPRIKEEKTSSPVKLPEASFSIIEAWNWPDAPERPKSYYRFIEKSPEELEDEVEYDMDEDDFTWLEFVNKQRKFENMAEVNPESFEMLMDRLEKECYFQMQSSGRDQGPPIDEDAVCCICMDGECQNSNVILFCDMCNLAVHQECYGVPYIPEGQWLCRRCLQSPSRAVDCALCPNRGGAFKQTDDGRWAHVVCALWIPEVCFANTVFLEPIDSIQNIPAARWKLTCYICKQRGAGACIQCHRANCYTAFHVTCAQQAGLHMKIDAVKDSPTSGPNISVRKTAYCDTHTPPDSDSKPMVGDSSLGETIRKAQSKAAFREKMRKARKILAEKRSAAPIVSIPTIPPERVQEIASSIQIPGKNRFIQRLIAYWTLKRQSRNGVPLLRRLQTSHPSRRAASVPPPDSASGQSQVDDIMFQLRYFQRLRQDLERARLLCELIRKREKTKRELMKVKEKELELRLYPLQYLMRCLLQSLKEKDTNEIFAEPVDVSEVPDYLDFIKIPMDFSTMAHKLESLQYSSVDMFEKDFNLMISNCMVYNSQQTMYYKAAVKLKDSAQPVFQQIRRDLETLYAGRDTGDEGQHPQQAEQSQQSQPSASSSSSASSTTSSSSSFTPTIMDDIDQYLADKRRESESPEQQLSKLEDYLRKAQGLPQGTAKAKRIRLLRTELAKVRRRLSLQAGGRAAATRSSSPTKPGAGGIKKEAESSGDSNSESSSESDDQSSDSESSASEVAVPRGRPKATATATPRAAVRQLKIDSFVTRTSKATDGSDSNDPKSPTVASSNSKSRLVAKVMKRNREPASTNSSSNPAATKQNQQQQQQQQQQLLDSDLENHSHVPPTLPSTPAKSTSNQTNPNLTGSPSGVNRRTAVLFTKKAAAAFKKPEGNSSAFGSGVSGGSGNSSPPRRSVGRPRKTSESSTAATTTLTSSNNGTGLNVNNSTNLFVAAASATTTTSTSTPSDSSRQRQKKQRPGAAAESHSDKLFSGSLLQSSGMLGGLASSETSVSLPNIERESFKVYRSRPAVVDDEDSNRGSGSSCSGSSSSSSGSGSSSSSSSNESSDESDGDVSDESHASPRQSHSKSSAGHQAHYLPLPCSEIPLQPLDLVWAKCRGYPWYPALIVDPAWPRSGYVHNGVPIAIPPEDVLAMGSSVQQPAFLVLFFDAKRTWQWLPRNKLEPLGVDPDRDKAKLIESKKQTERKAVKKAFEEAILHQCRVAGQSAALSEDSNSSHSM